MNCHHLPNQHAAASYRLGFASVLSLLVASLSFSCSVLAQVTDSTAEQPQNATSEPAFELQRLDWEAQLKSGTRVLLENRWGNINLRQSGGQGAMLHAVMQKIGSAPKVAELKVTEADQQIRLSIVYPPDQQPDSFREGRVDVALLIPAGIQLDIIADRGAVTGKTLHNPIKVVAVNERVEFSSTASVDISSAAGDVEILFKPRPETRQKGQSEIRSLGSIKTISGDILISYYPDVEIGFDMVSGNSKTTDDPRLLQSRSYKDRHVLMQTSERAETLSLQSDTGQIVLSNNRDRLGE